MKLHEYFQEASKTVDGLANALMDFGLFACPYCSEFNKLEPELDPENTEAGMKCDTQCAKHCLEWLNTEDEFDEP